METELTGILNLGGLTMHRLKDAIPQRGLLRKVKAWCPECYDEMREATPTIIYDPLIWSIRVVSICKKHRKQLVDLCPGCEKNNLIMERRSSPGFCSHCNLWLGNTKSRDICNHESLVIAEMVEQLLESNNTFSRRGISASLKQIVVHNNSNITQVARKFSVPKTTFWAWLRHSHIL